MRLVATARSHQHEGATDPWTAVHLGSGLAMGLTGSSATLAALAALGYQLLEQRALRDEGLGTAVQQLTNAAIDVMAFMGGWAVGRRFMHR